MTQIAPIASTDTALRRVADAPDDAARREAALRKSAQDFEAAFLAEMLGRAGLSASRETFGGGEGEEAFASFLSRERAEKMAEAGGIGLAEHIYRALVARSEGAAPGAAK